METDRERGTTTGTAVGDGAIEVPTAALAADPVGAAIASPALALDAAGLDDWAGVTADVALLPSGEAIGSGEFRTAATTMAAAMTRARSPIVVTPPDSLLRGSAAPCEGGLPAWLDMTRFSIPLGRRIAIKASTVNVVMRPDGQRLGAAGPSDGGTALRLRMTRALHAGLTDSPRPLPRARR
jgi:hypothetical protein